MTKAWKAALAAAAILLNSWAMAEEGPREEKTTTVSRGDGAVSESMPATGLGAAVARAGATRAADACHAPELVAAPSRPVWTAGAATTQCGSLETDYGWLWQGMGGGLRQTAAAMSLRYGLTSRLDVRWGVPAHLAQSGGGTQALQGAGDQSISLTCRFMEQGVRMPAMAVGYGLKIPTANPTKGFGSGFTDHQLLFIASRDVGRVHLDFNTAGTLAGGPTGVDGAMQAGLVLSLPVGQRLTGLVETNGGSQPGTEDRFGQALVGSQFSLRSWLVLDAAYARAYTAGMPRQQLTFGWTWSSRPDAVARTRARVARWLER